MWFQSDVNLCPKNEPQHGLTKRIHVLFEMTLLSQAIMVQQNINSCKNSWKGNERSLLHERQDKCRHLGDILSFEVTAQPSSKSDTKKSIQMFKNENKMK